MSQAWTALRFRPCFRTCLKTTPHHALLPRRERKKAKYCNLQGTVDMLTAKLEALKTVERENVALRTRAAVLQKRVADQEAQLGAMEAASSEAQLKSHTQMLKLQDQERLLHEQSALMQKQAAELRDAEVEIRALRARADTGCNECIDAKQLIPMIKAIISELQVQQPATASLPAHVPESLVAQICRCCREMDSTGGSGNSNSSKPKCCPPGDKAISVSCC